MDTSSILCCLRTILSGSSIKSFYVIPKNRFEDIVYSRKTLIICNTSATMPGEHWVAFIVYSIQGSLTAEYFDSFAKPVEFYGIKTPFRVIRSMNMIVQSGSSETCALHCLFFAYLKAKMKTIQEISLRYSNNVLHNDNLVKDFYKIVSLSNKNNSVNKCCGKYKYKL
jgi:hypothetical protein